MKSLGLRSKRWPFVVVAFLMAGLPTWAHEKWFVDPETYHGAIPEVFAQPTTFGIVAILIGIILFLALLAFDRSRDGAGVSRRFDAWFDTRRLNPRTILAVSIGVSLMGAGFQRLLFAPGIPLPDGVFWTALAILQTFLGLGFIFLEPYLAELGAALGLLWFAAFISGLPIGSLLEELFMLGAGLYFMTGERHRQPWARWNTDEVRRRGYQMFRILVGLNFLVLSTVKWFRPDLAIALIEKYQINFLSVLGVSDAQFVFMAALVETLVALCILFRAAFRPICAVAMMFFILTIYAFGFHELLGHLPIKAALFLFIVNGHWHIGEKKPLG